MRIGYLMNSYPMTSTTFIRREIAAHEAAGATVLRYAIRHWDGPLVEPADIAEQGRTEYLLTGRGARLVAGLFAAALRHPRAVFRAARATRQLHRRAGGGAGAAVRHAAWLMEAIRFRALARRDGIGHVHAHFSTNAAAVAMLSRLMGGPGYSFTVHGPDELLDTAGNALDEKVAHAAFVAAISRYCQNVIRKASAPQDAAKVQVVRCGIDLPDFPPAGPLPPEAPLLCVGRLCKQKAQTLLVEAAALLRDSHPDLRILLIGDGETRAEIEDGIARHGLEGRIILHGWGTGAEVRAALDGARALVLPSFAEGLPVVIMEALAMERPAISTRIAGIPELVDEGCGWIVGPGDVPALAAAIGECLTLDEAALRDRGREGRRRVIERHDQAKTAAELRAHIARAMAEG